MDTTGTEDMSENEEWRRWSKPYPDAPETLTKKAVKDQLYPPVPKSGMDTPLDFDAADALYSLRVDPGLAYVQGYECGFTNPFYVYGNKPRSLHFIDNNFTNNIIISKTL